MKISFIELSLEGHRPHSINIVSHFPGGQSCALSAIFLRKRNILLIGIQITKHSITQMFYRKRIFLCLYVLSQYIYIYVHIIIDIYLIWYYSFIHNEESYPIKLY